MADLYRNADDPAYEVGDRVLVVSRHHWDRKPEAGVVHHRRQTPNGQWQYDVCFPGCCVWEFVYESQMERQEVSS